MWRVLTEVHTSGLQHALPFVPTASQVSNDSYGRSLKKWEVIKICLWRSVDAGQRSYSNKSAAVNSLAFVCCSASCAGSH